MTLLNEERVVTVRELAYRKRLSNEELVLQHLRAFGPCSIGLLTSTLRGALSREQVYAAVGRLKKKNLAIHLAKASYDVTKRGRRVCVELCHKGKGIECQRILFD